MSRRFLVPIDLSRNEIQNAVAQVLGTAPASPVPGQFYYDSVVGRLIFRGASAWIDPTDRQHHSGTQTAATISNFDAAVRVSRLDQMAAPTVALNLNNQRVSNLANGVSATDAATFGQLQEVLNGRQFKDAVRVASTTNITTLSGLLTIDGITLVAGDRVLVKNQTTASQNGIYLAATGTWTRATDADSATPDSEVKSGMTVMVSEGTTQADQQWTLTTNAPITIGTTSLTFVQTGVGTTYTQGTGISIAGNVIAVDTAVVARKFALTLSTSATAIPVTHNLGTLDVRVEVYEVATGETVECDVTRNTVNQITVGFAVAPAANTMRVCVVG